MNWRIDFSDIAFKFLRRNHLQESFIADKIILVIRKFRGEDVNVSIGKLTGEWEGFYRIRVGKLRIIVSFQFESYKAHIDKIDWRGNAYK